MGTPGRSGNKRSEKPGAALEHIRPGRQIWVGPLRIYINWNHQGSCDTFVFYGTEAELGHAWAVDEAVIQKLIEEAEHVEYERPVDGEVVEAAEEPQGAQVNQGSSAIGSDLSGDALKLTAGMRAVMLKEPQGAQETEQAALPPVMVLPERRAATYRFM